MSDEQFKARAVQRHLRRAPRKLRLVVDTVRGKKVSEALSQLKFIKKAGAEDVAKVITSAAANMRDKFQEERFDNEELIISEIYVDQGPSLKRIQPAAMGRAHQIKKRTSHITVVVTKEQEELINE